MRVYVFVKVRSDSEFSRQFSCLFNLCLNTEPDQFFRPFFFLYLNISLTDNWPETELLTEVTV